MTLDELRKNEDVLLDLSYFRIGSELEGFKKVGYIQGEDRRWSRSNTVVIQEIATDKYYEYHCEEGLTEIQDDGIDPFRFNRENGMIDMWEVKPRKHMVEVTYWDQVEKV